MKKIKLGVVGLGFGRYGHIPAFQVDPRCEIVAVCSTSIERAKKVAQELSIPCAYDNYQMMLNQSDCDAISIATPPKSQEEIAMAGLRKSKAIFAEKPFSLTFEGALRLASLAKEANTANVVDFIFPEIDVWKKAHQLLNEGAIGSIRHVIIQWAMESYDHRNNQETWKTDSSLGGGVLSHFASHVFYYIEWFLSSIRTLSANFYKAPDIKRPGETMVNLSMILEEGQSVCASICNSAVFGSGHHIEFYGDKGAMILYSVSNDDYVTFRLLLRTNQDTDFREISKTKSTVSTKVDSRVEPLSRLASRFLDWIEKGAPTRPSFQDGLRVQMLLEKARLSHEKGIKVEI